MSTDRERIESKSLIWDLTVFPFLKPVAGTGGSRGGGNPAMAPYHAAGSVRGRWNMEMSLFRLKIGVYIT